MTHPDKLSPHSLQYLLELLVAIKYQSNPTPTITISVISTGLNAAFDSPNTKTAKQLSPTPKIAIITPMIPSINLNNQDYTSPPVYFCQYLFTNYDKKIRFELL